MLPKNYHMLDDHDKSQLQSRCQSKQNTAIFVDVSRRWEAQKWESSIAKGHGAFVRHTWSSFLPFGTHRHLCSHSAGWQADSGETWHRESCKQGECHVQYHLQRVHYLLCNNIFLHVLTKDEKNMEQLRTRWVMPWEKLQENCFPWFWGS